MDFYKIVEYDIALFSKVPDKELYDQCRVDLVDTESKCIYSTFDHDSSKWYNISFYYHFHNNSKNKIFNYFKYGYADWIDDFDAYINKYKVDMNNNMKSLIYNCLKNKEKILRENI